MKILMCTSEATPLAKTGGLADVVHALSRELNTLGHEAVIMMPFYQSIKEKPAFKVELVNRFSIYLSWRSQECEVYRTKIDGVTYYLLGNKRYFDRQNLYGYDDDTERFAFFTLAVRKVIKEINFKPDIIQCHDWHAGMLPVIIKEQNICDPFYSKIKFVITIHNPAFKGMFDPYLLGDYYSLDQEVFTSGRVRFDGRVSSLKAAIIYSDKITTVSPTHANELLSSESGHNLEEVMSLRKDDFVGILNGIDYEEFNSETDTKIEKTFNKSSLTKGKQVNKESLLRLMNIDINDKPLFGIVSRLTWQKGSELIIEGARHLLEKGCSIVILGSGEYNFEQQLEGLRSQYPNHMAIYIGYNDELAHRIYAGSDFFLMPSLFEPCGIGQMIALRYASLPLVRMTGGLNDTIVPYSKDNRNVANGFGFYAYETQAINNTIDWVINCYSDKELLKTLRKNAFTSIHDWKSSAQEYVNLYKQAIKNKKK